MKKPKFLNHLRAHRKKSGLSQHELGLLVGYRYPGPVSKHERMKSLPPLDAALAYEAVFRAPVSTLFANVSFREAIEKRLEEMEENLGQRDARDPGAELTAQKLIWLRDRKTR